MLNRITTTVVSPAVAALDGFYEWVGAENDCDYRGEIRGYHCGYCVEVADSEGKLGYCSVSFVPYGEGTDILLPEMKDGSLTDGWNDLGISASCARRGYTPTGRLVFRGYYKSEWDYDEREEVFFDASKEVEALWNKWVI